MTQLPVIGFLSIGVSIMALIVIILLLMSLLLLHPTDWDDKRVDRSILPTVYTVNGSEFENSQYKILRTTSIKMDVLPTVILGKIKDIKLKK